MYLTECGSLVHYRRWISNPGTRYEQRESVSEYIEKIGRERSLSFNCDPLAVRSNEVVLMKL